MESTLPQSSRVRLSAAELLKRYVEVQKVPEALLREMHEPPLSNLISHYYVKPVNFDPNPFSNSSGGGSGQQQQQHYGKQGGQFQRGAGTGGYKNRGGGNNEGGFSRPGGGGPQRRPPQEADNEDSDEFEVVENKPKTQRINKAQGASSGQEGFQKAQRKPMNPAQNQTQAVIQRPSTTSQAEKKPTLPAVAIQDWTQAEAKPVEQPVPKKEEKLVLQEVPKEIKTSSAPKQDQPKDDAWGSKVEEKKVEVPKQDTKPAWALTFEQQIKTEAKPAWAVAFAESKHQEEEPPKIQAAEEVKTPIQQQPKQEDPPKETNKEKKKGDSKKAPTNPETKTAEDTKKAVKFSQEPPQVQEVPKSTSTSAVENKPFSWDAIAQQQNSEPSKSGKKEPKKQPEFVFNLPELSGTSKEEQKSSTQKRELTLDEIMREQELEAQRQAADKKRREMLKKSNDPLSLNYIKPTMDDIFVNPKAAQQALASKATASPSLDQIMKEQAAQSVAAKKLKR